MGRRLVLVGGHHERTSSVAREERFLAQASSLSDRVIDLGHVPEGEQLALYRDAALVPFRRSTKASGSSLRSRGPGHRLRVCPAAGHGRVPACVRCAAIVRPRGGGRVRRRPPLQRAARASVVDAISEIASGLTWDRTAAGYLAVYERALACPRRAVSNRCVQVSRRHGDLGAATDASGLRSTPRCVPAPR